MGLTFRKRDDCDKMMDTLGVSNVDVLNTVDKTTKTSDKIEDPFAKFLAADADQKGIAQENEQK